MRLKLSLELQPGLLSEHATHFRSAALFCNIHVGHSHEPLGAANLSFKSSLAPVPGLFVSDAAHLSNSFLSLSCCSCLSWPVLLVFLAEGFAVSQATHFTASALLLIKHEVHSHEPAAGANRWAKSIVCAGSHFSEALVGGVLHFPKTPVSFVRRLRLNGSFDFLEWFTVALKLFDVVSDCNRGFLNASFTLSEL